MTSARVSWVRTAFRVTAFVEAVSWLGLLVAMAFKYVVADNPEGVHVMGPIHGIAFLAYVGATVVAARVFRWPLRVVVVGLLASLPPFGSAVFEVWTGRRGHLADASRSGPQAVGSVATAPRDQR